MADHERVFLGLGSNQGAVQANLLRAIEELKKLDGTSLEASSTFVETEPWGVTDQPCFLNAVIEIRTALEPSELLSAIKRIEGALGRKPTRRWGPRIIDIDILVYGHRTVVKPELVIPHPYATQRDFIMMPLREIAPQVATGLMDGSWTKADD
jgi:2-amino-4-hydroxy-6-hydroxymethyldihydropteridine diphosphokinase